MGSADIVRLSGKTSKGLALFIASACNEWYTLASLLDLVTTLFAPGVIDFNPCSSRSANSVVGAHTLVSAAEDGLSRIS
jgi:hypothetical protein